MCVKIWVLLCKIKKEISGERIEGTEVLVMKRHKRRRREVSVVRRRRAAIVLPSVLPNSPLFFLWTVPVCEQTGRSQEAGERAVRELAGS